MLNRRQLRIKALESVYAYDKSLDKNIDFQISYFLKSNKNFFKLYVTCFSLLKELHLFANELHLKNQKKYINKDSDLNLEKFCNNSILKRINSNDFLSKKIEKLGVNYWYTRSELISSIWNDIIESEISFKYLNDENKSFELDKSYLTNLFRKVIASNKKLYDFFEDTEISWINDLPLVNSLVLSSIKNSKKSSKNILLMTDIYKNDEDAEFGVKLLKSVINNKETLQDYISKITLNWDNDRIAQIDLILLEMCLAEFLFFKSIPVKASINEYLEIAKEYSSKKSNIFINGILDKLSKDLSNNGTLKKNKRGMQ